MKVRLDPDAIDLEALKTCAESPGFAMILRRCAETHAKELAGLATAESWDNVRYKQGVIAGIDIACSVPKILEGEIRAAMAKKRKANA